MIVFLLALIGLSLWAVVSRFNKTVTSSNLSKACRPITKHYPHLDPLGGLDLPIRIWKEFRRGEMAEGARRRHESLGTTFTTRYLGSTSIYTIDPDNIRSMTTGNFEHWGKSPWVQEAGKHIGHGVLLNDGEAWKESRNVLKPIFARLPDTSAFLEPHLQHLMQAIREKRTSAFNFQELSDKFVLDVSTELLFGRSTEILTKATADSRDAHQFLLFVKQFESPAALFMSVGALSWLELLPVYKQLLRCVDGMKSFFRKQLDLITLDDGFRASSTHSATPPAAQTQTATWSTSPGVFRMLRAQGVPVDEIQGELQNIFFASYDTTSALLASLIEALARHPDVQQRLRREISECLGDRPATGQDVTKMGYLHCVVSEGASHVNPSLPPPSSFPVLFPPFPSVEIDHKINSHN